MDRFLNRTGSTNKVLSPFLKQQTKPEPGMDVLSTRTQAENLQPDKPWTTTQAKDKQNKQTTQQDQRTDVDKTTVPNPRQTGPTG